MPGHQDKNRRYTECTARKQQNVLCITLILFNGLSLSNASKQYAGNCIVGMCVCVTVFPKTISILGFYQQHES